MEKNKIYTNKINHLAVLVLLVAIVYGNTFSSEFVWDDTIFIQDWELPKKLWWDDANFLKETFRGDVPEGHQGVYRPLRTVFYGLSYWLWGDESPLGYHFQALVIHLLITLLIYGTVSLIAGNYLNLLTASLFAVHPIHTSAVSFITTSFDLIGVVFFFASVYFFVMSRRMSRKKQKITKNNTKKHKQRRISAVSFSYGASILCAVLAFLTYELTFTLPLLIMLFDLYFPLRKRPFSHLANNWKMYVPYWVILSVLFVTRFLILDIPHRGSYLAGSFYLTMLTMSKALVKYISLLVLPVNLSVNHVISEGIYGLSYYDFNHAAVASQSFFDAPVFLSILVIFFLLYVCVKVRHSYVSFSLAFFFVSMTPVMYFLPQGTILAEKYLYIASFAYCFLLALVFAGMWSWGGQSDGLFRKIYRKTDGSKHIDRTADGSKHIHNTCGSKPNFGKWSEIQMSGVQKYKILLSIVFVGIIIFFSWQTISRNNDWQNCESLWSASYNQVPDSGLVNSNLGVCLLDLENYSQAESFLIRAAELKRNDSFTHFNLAVLYEKTNRNIKAREEYKKAIALQPSNSQAHYNYGRILHQKGELDKALGEYKSALEFNPNSQDALLNLANIHLIKGSYNSSLVLFTRLIREDTGFAPGYEGLGSVLLHLERPTDALPFIQKAVVLNNQSFSAWKNLGNVHYQLHRPKDAIKAWQTALELQEDPFLRSNVEILQS